MTTLSDLRQKAKEHFPAGTNLGLIHMLIAWASDDTDDELELLLIDSGIDRDFFANTLQRFIKNPPDNENNLLINCIKSFSNGEVTGTHIIKTLCSEPEHIYTSALINAGLNVNSVILNINELENQHTFLSRLGIRIDNKCPNLMKYGRNLTMLAGEGHFKELCVRPKELNKIVNILLRKRKSNIAITGNAGVGKTALVELLALEILNNNFELYGYEVFEISMGKLVAGTKYRGDFEARFEDVMNEIQKAAPAILFLDELHLIFGAGRAEGAPLDAANMIKPYLARDNFKVIGATTSTEYQKYIACDEALSRRFQELKLDEPDQNTLELMIMQQAKQLSDHHKVEIFDHIVKEAILLTNKYLLNRQQPDKSIDLLDVTAVEVLRNKGEAIKKNDLLNSLSNMTGNPIGVLSGKEKINLKKLENILATKVIGQREAIEKVVQNLIHRRMDFGNSDRPLGVFLFAGDSGVGKTELARNIAIDFCGGINKLVTIDLGEYSGRDAVNKLIGAPPGYVGSDETGTLIKGLQTHASCVILFDEIEKVDQSIHQLVLGLLDNGRITDSKGRTYDARQCVIIMTTNALTSSELRKTSLGFSNKEPEPDIFKLLSNHFSREFLGRIDEIIPFNSLTEKNLRDILSLRIKEAVEKLEKKGIFLEFDARLLEFLSTELKKEKNGARGIARLLEKKVLQPLALSMLDIEDSKKVIVKIDDDFFENGIISYSQN